MRTPLLLCILLILKTFLLTACASPLSPEPTSISTPGMTPTSLPVLQKLNGNFRNQVSLLEDNMPRAHSEKYSIPNVQEQAKFAELVSEIHNQHLAGAAEIAGENHYTLHAYTDRGDDGAVSYLLREQRPIQKGWGLYAFRVNSTSNLIIEAPHPRSDQRTPSVALDVYRALDARALLIAGAHRNANRGGSADVAHAPESIFQTVHRAFSQEIQTELGEAIVLQIHGFHTSKHNGYPPAVIGFGKEMQLPESSLAQKFEAEFSKQGIEAGICIRDDIEDLCGRTNVQGSSPQGIIFIHLEVTEKIRKNDQALIAALVQIFGG